MDTTASEPRLSHAARETAQRPPHEARSLGGLFSDLWRQTTRLVHDEAELAKADVSEKVSQAVAGAGTIAAGGAVLFAGFLYLLLAIVSALGPYLPPEHAHWLAPCIVGIVVMAAGYALYAGGRRELKAQNMKPTRVTESLRRDKAMVKEHLQ